MTAREDRFVEWALESDRYVMVEIVHADGPERTRRHLSSPLRDVELTVRLLDAGISSPEVVQLLSDARRRAQENQRARPGRPAVGS